MISPCIGTIASTYSIAAMPKSARKKSKFPENCVIGRWKFKADRIRGYDDCIRYAYSRGYVNDTS